MREQLDVSNLLVKLTTSLVLILASLFPSMSIAQSLAVPTIPPVRSTQKPPNPPPTTDKEEDEKEDKESQEEAEEAEEGGGTEQISPK
jgi:hypothetical protein